MQAAVIHLNGGPDVLHCEDRANPARADHGIGVDVETVSIEGGDPPGRLTPAMTP